MFPDNLLTIINPRECPLQQGEDCDSETVPTKQEDMESLVLWPLVDCEEGVETREACSIRKNKPQRL